MTKREAKRLAYQYVLALTRNFGDGWESILHDSTPDDAARLDAAMEELRELLKRGARRREGMQTPR